MTTYSSLLRESERLCGRLRLLQHEGVIGALGVWVEQGEWNHKRGRLQIKRFQKNITQKNSSQEQPGIYSKSLSLSYLDPY